MITFSRYLNTYRYTVSLTLVFLAFITIYVLFLNHIMDRLNNVKASPEYKISYKTEPPEELTKTKYIFKIYRNAYIEPILPITEYNVDKYQTVSSSPTVIDNKGSEAKIRDGFIYQIEEPVIEIDTVLVAQKNTIISSTRDGKVVAVNYDDGDIFHRGDVLVEYDCRDVRAELTARRKEADFTRKKAFRGQKLFKLDIISNLESSLLDTEQVQAEAQRELLEQRFERCVIRADYNGRIVRRSINPGEYTRTDRVLMEVASLDDLDAEFLLPSRWLRWVNVEAPVDIEVFETSKIYAAKVTRFHGEVDPSSQTIQVSARLEPYEEPLLPGMSGTAKIDAHDIRSQGITGYLETGRRY